MLKFSPANAKTSHLTKVPGVAHFLANKRKVYSLDLLSGWSCPFACDCLSKVKVDSQTGKRSLQDGPHTQFRCFSASQEIAYTNTYNARKHNFELLRSLSTEQMISAIISSMPKNLGVLRFHVAGDFFSPAYFRACCAVARQFPDRLFYTYTKSIKYWITYQHEVPKNFVLTASYGGRDDSLIKSYGLRNVKVVFSEKEAGKLPIDHDDSHAANPSMRKKNFALLLHGIQPKGSAASKALQELRKSNVKHSYSRGK